MNNTAKYIIGIIIVLIIVVGGIYLISKHSSSPAASSTATTTAATSTDQVQGQDVSIGTGAQATPGSQVSVLYVGYVGQIATSTIFDSSAAHGNQPLTFVLGSQNLIPGFQIGINGMKVGGERLIAIPPSLGYGATGLSDSSGNVVIPPNATIIFDVKLVDVEATTTSATSTAQ